MKYAMLVGLMLATGCQIAARSAGGTDTLRLPPGQKLVTITWKEADLWYLIRPMTATDTALTYQFKESSALGVLSGTIIVVETPAKVTP